MPERWQILTSDKRDILWWWKCEKFFLSGSELDEIYFSTTAVHPSNKMFKVKEKAMQLMDEKDHKIDLM